MQMQSLLSNSRPDQERTLTYGFIQALSESALTSIVRAELKRVILPAVEESFSYNKSQLDLQMGRTQQAIDKMTQSLGHMLKDEPTSDRHPWTQVPAQTVFRSDWQEGEMRPGSRLDEHEIPRSGIPWPSKDCLGDQLSLWSRTWTYRWSIGFLCVRIYTSRTRSKDGATSQAFGCSTSAWSEEVYHLSISFLPAHRILSKGMSLTTGSRSDQSGYYLMCPEITTFAIVPDDSEVFSLVNEGNIEGLKRLFVGKLASPTDRRRDGSTVLLVG